MTVTVVDYPASREDPGTKEVEFTEACQCPLDVEWSDTEVQAMEDAAWEAYDKKIIGLLDAEP